MRRLSLGPLVALLLGACTVALSYRDPTTYRNLTDLKVDVTVLVASFDEVTRGVPDAVIHETRLKLRKAYEYERGKGSPNSDTVQQLGQLVALFESVVSDFDSGEDLGARYFAEAALQLEQAFDIAIATEYAKNEAPP